MSEFKVTHAVLAEELAKTFNNGDHFIDARWLIRSLLERLQQAGATKEMQDLLNEMAQEGMNATWFVQEDLAREMPSGFKGEPPLLYFFGHPAFGSIESARQE